MGYSDRSTATDLIDGGDELIIPDEISSYNFFQLVELIHKLDGNNPEGQEWESLGNMFFSANPSLGFPASDVTRIERHPKERVQIETTFLGLNGAQSPLPSYMLEELLHDDSNIKRDFLDFFNNRLIALFYRAWRKYRYYIRFQDNAVDNFSSQVFALVGLANEDVRGETPINWCKMLAYAGMLAGRSRSPQAVAGIVAHCFDLENVSIREWEFRHVEIPEQQRCQLGRFNSQLGIDTVLGEKVGDITGKFVLCIKDLSLHRFQDFLPSGKEFMPLCKVMEVILREQMAFDFELTLKTDEVPLLRLGEEKGGQLGWSSFLGQAEIEKQHVLIQIRQ
ncbi:MULTISPECIES: type VI secretion system baseplate subunit TssG [Shewanella]|uniref:Type VI secretion system baseplate subunit TssG n=1 Tax=Shewanella nanhaiensis TaxID=2864872 RepID=A0ABS7E6Y4_9GAMM|nr:type VI secretion system baseplate subunit TssG [Shewanella nanhaiensis]MBW8185415.1 type VI secretion system baseplate subunit TssG [Shewanella nanhaiensis]